MNKSIDQLSPAEAVSAGYDATADLYQDFIVSCRQREQRYYLNVILERLKPGSNVLDIGCGSGVPTTLQLEKQFCVTGVDISLKQIELAKKNLSRTNLVCGDIVSMSFAEASFDGAVAFYSLFHIPRSEHESFLASGESL